MLRWNEHLYLYEYIVDTNTGINTRQVERARPTYELGLKADLKLSMLVVPTYVFSVWMSRVAKIITYNLINLTP